MAPDGLLYDPATGLHTREWILDMQAVGLQVARRNGTSLAVLAITYGPGVGAPELLPAEAEEFARVLGRRMAGLLRGGTLLGRCEPDQFVVLAPDITGAHRVRPIAQRLVNAAKQVVVVGQRELHPRVSVGIAVSGPSSTPSQLMRQAAMAARLAEAAGGNRWQFFAFDDDRASAAADARPPTPRPREEGARSVSRPEGPGGVAPPPAVLGALPGTSSMIRDWS